MRDKVLAFLKDKTGLPEERYNEAMSLMRKSEGKSIPAVNYYNRAGYTAENLKTICYDLQTLHGIKDLELRAKKAAKAKVKKLVGSSENGFTMSLIKAIQEAPEELKVAIKIAEKYTELWESDVDALGFYYDAVVAFGEKHKELLENEKANHSDKKFADLFTQAVGDVEIPAELITNIEAALGSDAGTDTGKVIEGTDFGVDSTDITKKGTDIPENGTAIAKIETSTSLSDQLKEKLANAPEPVKGGLKLRERFAFLGEKDCPDKLKVLVADMLTAWDDFKAGHTALTVVATESGEKTLTSSEIYELAKETIDAFELNHAIWDELEYYNEHKEILGNHPIFADEKLKEKVAGLEDAAVVNRRNNVRSYISKEKKKLKPDTTEEAAKKINTKIKELNQELLLLEERLSPPAPKGGAK